VEFLGGSRKDLRELPGPAQKAIGDDLLNVQWGAQPRSWRPMPSVGPGVIEMRVRAGGAYRLLYIASHAECVYVLHAFEKKSRKSPTHDLAVARARLATLGRSTREDE
jgi:phage-related protein